MTKQFRVPRQAGEPHDFELVYDKLIDGDWKEQTDKFRARHSVPGNLLVSMAASTEGSAGVQAKELQRLFNQVIVPDDKARFNEVLDDPDTAVPIETLGEIVQWLAETYANRPTQSV
jgi:hypothetical protein